MKPRESQRELQDYEDLLQLPHHTPYRHPQLSRESRAAQFAPYAALTGYEDLVKETARETGHRIRLDDSVRMELDRCLYLLDTQQHNHPSVKVRYFIPDEKRMDGGEYVQVAGSVHRLDAFAGLLLLTDGTTIPMDDII